MTKFLVEDQELTEDDFKPIDEALFYNDNNAQYSTKIVSKGLPRYEEVQIRFNNILQKRVQLEENLTGSQIAYLLDFYVERCFDILTWNITSNDKMMEMIQVRYLKTIQQFIKNRRKLFSIRFSNEEVLDVLVELFFETDIKVFTERFLNMKLNREVYLDFLDAIFVEEVISNKDQIEYFQFYRKQYTEFKNLLLGNYIRYSFVETNKFFSYYKDNISLEAKEDYFSGLMIVILKVIDKYDSFKGTLTSFIENWFKDYRTTFKARQKVIDSSIDIDDEAVAHNYSLANAELTDHSQQRDVDFRKQILEGLVLNLNMSLPEIKKTVEENAQFFPNINKLFVRD